MLVIGIETSGAAGGVALVRGDTPIAEEALVRGLRHGRSLVPALQRVLASARIEPEQLDLVAVTRGPGSHTGLRVGLMAAMTMARTLARPVVGIETLDALCFQAPEGAPAIVPVIPARQDRLFAAIRAGGAWIREPALVSPAELETAAPPGAVLIGPGVPALREVLDRRRDLAAAPPADWEVRASTIARLGARRRDLAGPPDSLVAVYFPR